MKIRFLTTCMIILSLSACNKDNSDKTSPIAKNFLNEVLNIMEKKSINKDKINWYEFKDKVYQKITGAQTIEDTYPGIAEALTLLGDNHSSFIKPDGNIIYGDRLPCLSESVNPIVIQMNVGYVQLKSYNGSTDGDDAIAFAKKIQEQIRRLDNINIIGWIVDLRGNGGSTMWPMLAGIGPILGEGVAGYFYPNGIEVSYGYNNGSSVSNGINSVTRLSDSYKLLVPNPKVAVLLDKGTASSGEALAISFIGRGKTKSFGSSTCGTSTWNSAFKLSNNSSLVLTTAYLADRNKNVYGIPIVPDMISNPETIIEDALEWLKK